MSAMDCAEEEQGKAIDRLTKSNTSAQNEDEVDKTPVKTTFLNIPKDIHVFLFTKYLDKTTSICLGLTNKYLYAIHEDITGKVPLKSWVVIPFSTIHYCDGRLDGSHLFELLVNWAAQRNSGLMYHPQVDKFITREYLETHPFIFDRYQDDENVEFRLLAAKLAGEREQGYEINTSLGGWHPWGRRELRGVCNDFKVKSKFSSAE